MARNHTPELASSPAQPLLQEDREAVQSDNTEERSTTSGPISRHYNRHRQRVRAFLASKTQHYCVLTLVSLDVLSIFAEIFINLYTCKEGKPTSTSDRIISALGVAGLILSCLFMVELILSVWAFGWRYFASWFHTLDATVIVAGFVVDVLLKGVLEEVASLVVVLRLWRFFKIIEEFSVGAAEQMDALRERLEILKGENENLKIDLERSKSRGKSQIRDEEMGI